MEDNTALFSRSSAKHAVSFEAPPLLASDSDDRVSNEREAQGRCKFMLQPPCCYSCRYVVRSRMPNSKTRDETRHGKAASGSGSLSHQSEQKVGRVMGCVNNSASGSLGLGDIEGSSLPTDTTLIY